MRTNMKMTATLALFMVFMLPAYAAAESDMLGGSFTDDGIAARPAGLAGAYTAIADDGNAAWWNPAGMALLDRKKSVSISYIPDIYNLDTGEITRIFLSYGQGDTAGFGALGGSISYLGVNLGSDYTGDMAYKWTEYVLSVSWGMEVQQYLGMAKYKYPKVSLGVSAKYMGVSTDLTVGGENTGASGFGADAGLMIAVKNNFNIGLAVKNAFTAVSWIAGSEESVPRQYNAGVFYGLTPDFLLAAEIKASETDSGIGISAYCAAAEYIIRFGKGVSGVQNVAIRSGITIDPGNDVYIIPVGASLGMEGFSVDFVYQKYLNFMLAPDMYRLGVTASF